MQREVRLASDASPEANIQRVIPQVEIVGEWPVAHVNKIDSVGVGDIHNGFESRRAHQMPEFHNSANECFQARAPLLRARSPPSHLATWPNGKLATPRSANLRFASRRGSPDRPGSTRPGVPHDSMESRRPQDHNEAARRVLRARYPVGRGKIVVDSSSRVPS